MKRVKNNHILYKELFSQYEHSIPIIFSALEGQYPCDLFVNDLDHPKYGLLFTRFDYHFLGLTKIEEVNSEDIKKTIIEYIHLSKSKECIMFAPSFEAEKMIKPIFEFFHGVIDVRVSFTLNQTKFHDLKKELNFNNLTLRQVKDGRSSFYYPQSEIKIDDKVVCYAKAFMLGLSQAEIDVHTEEQYRKKGYALLCSYALIEDLLHQQIIPNWSAWKHNKPSHQLAERLGFEFSKEINAYIWVDEFGKI